jgi:hypothetical protein
MLLGRRRGKAKTARPACTALFVHGVPYGNSAAKFWAGLLDEVSADHPRCSRIELSALCPGPLRAEQLHPELELERDLRLLQTQDIAAAMRRTLAMLELTGPPAPVGIRLFAGRRRLLARALPRDCVDAEIFPYLVGWLLRWACIRDERWNDEKVRGRFEAHDRVRGLRYDIALELASRHLSEGLYRRVVNLRPKLTAEQAISLAQKKRMVNRES